MRVVLIKPGCGVQQSTVQESAVARSEGEPRMVNVAELTWKVWSGVA